MDMSEAIKDLAKRSKNALETAQTEEATKNAVVMPMLRAFGFDVFDPSEVVPEFTADVGVKKGEKVDYAVRVHGKVAALIEVKSIGTDLQRAHYSQLYRYFSVTDARIAILTNGIQVWFFTDLDEKNKLDKRPFFKFDLHAYDSEDLREIAKFHKEDFDLDNILQGAELLKYQSAAMGYFRDQLENPDDELIRLVGKQIYDGSLTKTAIEQLRVPVKTALEGIVRDRIQERLNIAFSGAPEQPATKVATESAVVDDDGIETTQEEWEAFYIVRAICSEIIPPDRVTIRDAKSYCAVLADDNNRRPICRFFFNAKTVKYIGVFDAERNLEQIKIDRISDIFRHKDKIQETVRRYE